MKLVLLTTVALVLSILVISDHGVDVEASEDGATDENNDPPASTNVTTGNGDDSADSSNGDDSADSSTTAGPVPEGSSAESETTASSSGTELSCYSCGVYGTMKKECKTTDATTEKVSCPNDGCWTYSTVADAYARGCKSSHEDMATFGACSEFKEKTCKTVKGASMCAQCCMEADCNGSDQKKSAAITTTISGLLFTSTALVALIIK